MMIKAACTVLVDVTQDRLLTAIIAAEALKFWNTLVKPTETHLYLVSLHFLCYKLLECDKVVQCKLNGEIKIIIKPYSLHSTFL